MKKVQELREGNKKLEGKIEEQKRTKKMLKNLFLQQVSIINASLYYILIYSFRLLYGWKNPHKSS